MGIGKWIGGVLGFMAFGPLGALLTIIYSGARNLAPNLLAEDGSVGDRKSVV